MSLARGHHRQPPTAAPLCQVVGRRGLLSPAVRSSHSRVTAAASDTPRGVQVSRALYGDGQRARRARAAPAVRSRRVWFSVAAWQLSDCDRGRGRNASKHKHGVASD